MQFDAICEFLKKRMRMSHIYQPLLIRSLVDCDGMATLRQLAHAFLAQDESQLIYYENRIRNMPVPVLAKHGVVERDGQLVKLAVDRLTFRQKAKLKALCDQKIQDFLERRGLSTWDYRLLETEPVPDTVRYDVLRRAEGKCELCGVSSKERPLHVDHILPRSRKGTNDMDNLQALCDRCNLAKGNRDDTDFRRLADESRQKGCVFCATDIEKRVVERNGSVFAIEDKYPVTKGHCLIVPLRHAPDFFFLSEQERQESNELARYMKNRIQREDESVTGFNLGYNCGEAAGQTVMHAHLHLIPRRKGDVDAPEGGIRGAVPDKMRYRHA